MVDKKNTFKGTIYWVLSLMRLNWFAAKEYKASFAIQVVGMMINNSAFIIAWSFVFKIFGDIRGWGIEEMLALNGFVALSYGLIMFFSRGLAMISKKITEGSIDRFFTNPKNILINIGMSESGISAIGDITFGIISFVVFFIITETSIIYIPITILLLLVSTITYLGYIITTQSIIFWIPNSEELSDAMHHFMLGPALYPNNAFDGVIRSIFTFIIPSMVISTLPVNIIKSFDMYNLLTLFLISTCWLSLSIFIFYKGLKRYESGNLVGIH